MRFFLDRNRTLLPRVDFIYFLARIMILLGIVWFFTAISADHNNPWLFYTVVGTYIAHLILLGAAVRDKFDIKLAYLSAIFYDIIFLPLYISFTGSVNSSFYLLLFLTVAVAAYVLTFWFATAITTIVTSVYLLVIWPYLTEDLIFDVVMRIGFLLVTFLAISYASDHLIRSESRLIKLFDTLNMRTSELEKSQAQIEMIYENTRNLAAILEPDGVVKEVVRILDDSLQCESFAVVFKHSVEGFFFRARLIDGKVSLRPVAIPAGDAELIRKACKMDGPLIIKNPGERDDYIPLDNKAKSALIAPLNSYGRSHGVLIAESASTDFFSEREEQMLTIVGRSAGLALENAYLHKKTEELSTIDDLTGTYNYRYFVNKLQEEKKRAVRYDLPLSVIMVDIDWFKKINDSYGHEIGNVVLSELAVAIRSCIRDVDYFCRYGGEEFVVILPQTPQAEASVLGERIRKKVEQMVIDSGPDGKLKITISVGVSSFPENGKSAEELVSIADQALYRAKGSGKNLVCIE